MYFTSWADFVSFADISTQILIELVDPMQRKCQKSDETLLTLKVLTYAYDKDFQSYRAIFIAKNMHF